MEAAPLHRPHHTDLSSLFLAECAIFYLLLFQFPAVNHPQTLERRYLGIIGGGLLDLLKVGKQTGNAAL